MNALKSALDLIALNLRSIGFSVQLGVPTGEADLAVWPWHLRLAPLPGQAPINGRPRTPANSLQARLELQFLLVCKDTPDAVATMTQGILALETTPVLQVGGESLQLMETTLTAEELAALFSAAGVRLVLSSAYVLRGTG